MTTKISQDMIAASVGGIEVGDLTWSARSSKTGWLLCQGQAVSRAAYVALFLAIGTAFGVGDGATTFNVPDMKGRGLIGVGTGSLAESFLAAAVDTGTEVITVASNVDKWITGMKVQATTTGALPTGISAATDYYVIRASATTIKLASSLANALAGTAIDITAAGSGTHTLTHTLTARALGDKGGEEAHASTASEIPAHAHTQTAIPTGTAGASGAPVMANTSSGSEAAGSTSNSTGGNGAHNNMPPFLGANLFIYAGV